MQSIVLSYYPLLRSYVDDLSQAVGHPVSNEVISSLNVGGGIAVFRWALTLRVDTVYLPNPSPDLAPFLPLLRLIAALTKHRVCLRVDPGFRLQPEGTVSVLAGLPSLALRAALTVVALPWHFLLLNRLVKTPRHQPRATGQDDDVLYLKANLWSGVFAGGSVAHTVGVISGLEECGHSVVYVSPTEAPELAGIPHLIVHRLPLPFGFVYPREINILRYEHILKRWGRRQHRRDIAFLYHRLTLGSTAAIGISRRLGVPLVIEYNGSEVWISSHWGSPLKFPRMARLAEDAALRHADLIITVSTPLREELIARGIEPERIVICPNGVDPCRFDPARFTVEQTDAIRVRHGIPATAVVATFVGTFGPWHGAMVAAQALIALRKGEGVSNLHLVFIGDGVGRMAVEAELAENGVGDHCTFTGLLAPAEIPLTLAASDILLAPHVPNIDSSAFFGSPTKLFEYMAMGRPVVASRMGQIAEVLGGAPSVEQLAGMDGPPPSDIPGILVEPADPIGLAAALAFLAERPEWRRACGANGRARVLDRHTWKAHAQKITTGLDGVTLPAQAVGRRKTTVLINAVHAKSGGGVTYLRNVLPLLARRDDLVLHIAIQRGQDEMVRDIAADIPLHVLPETSRLATVLIQEQFALPRLARELGADVVFSPANYGPVWGAKTVILLRNSFDVSTIDARAAKRFYWLGVKMLSWLSFLSCRRAITVSHHACTTFTTAFRTKADLRFVVVPHGVSPLFRPPMDERGRHPHRLLAVSDIYIQKNLETAIAAVALLSRSYPDIALDIAGRTLDPEYFERLNQLCASLGIAGRINFLGSVQASQVTELYQRADVFVFPSVVETFGNPLLEAMASGLPVVCSNISAMPEVAGEAALYAEAGNAVQFAEAIARLFEDRDLWRAQSARGVERAGRFNWQRTADATARVLLAVADE